MWWMKSRPRCDGAVWKVAPYYRFVTSSRRFITSDSASEETSVGAREFAERRAVFLSMMKPHSVVLLPAADEVTYSNNIMYPFRQESLFHHLFGLTTPMRRSLAPPFSPHEVARVIPLTMAAFVRARGDAGFTLLFLPSLDTDQSAVTWASNRAVEQQQQQLLAHFTSGIPGNFAGDRDKIGGGGAGDTLYNSNDVFHTVRVLSRCIASMTHRSAGGKSANAVGPREESLRASLLPRLYFHFPAHVRWSGTRYRLPAPPDATAPGPLFHHPIDAILRLLCECRYTINPPHHLTDRMSRKVVCRYSPSSDSRFAAAFSSPACAGQRHRHQDLCDVYTELNHSITVAGVEPEICHSRAPADPVNGEVHHYSQLLLAADPLLWSYRAIKSPGQMTQHLRSAEVTVAAFDAAMRCAAGTVREHDVHCAFNMSLLESSRRLGPAATVRPAYIPVVASGPRALEIHYTDNDAVGVVEDALRLDGGAEVHGVPCDCTRTFPLGTSRFPESLRQVYTALLQLQRGLLQALGPGVERRQVARQHITETRRVLLQLGLGEPACAGGGAGAESQPHDPLPLRHIYEVFCAHGFGHFMGLDLHEQLGPSTGPDVFAGGMVHTVEPGLYLPDHQRASALRYQLAHIPAMLRGLAAQIEDDVLILPPPSPPEPAERRLWTRGDYLRAAVTWYTAAPLAHLWPPQNPALSEVLSLLPSHYAAPMRFLYEQRVCIEGPTKAELCFDQDLRAIQQWHSSRAAVAQSSGGEWEWFPHHIIVLTARIPKEVSHIERIMGGQG